MARIEHYDIGDVWVPEATFMNAAGVATDPTTVTARTRDPGGTVAVLGPVSGATGGSGITRVSAGTYTIDVALNDSGYWYARFEGTGTVAAAVEHEAIVDPSQFYETAQLTTRALVTIGEAKDWLNRNQIDYGDDLELARVINDLSDRMMEEADREFKPYAPNPASRLFTTPTFGQSRPWYVDGVYMGDLNPWRRTVPVGDLADITGLVVETLDTDWVTVLDSVAADTLAYPLNRKSWEPIRALMFHDTVDSLYPAQLVRVTGNWGFPNVPGNIRQACLDAVAWVLDRDVEHYRQDMGATPAAEGGTVIMMAGGGQQILALPPAVIAACWMYRDKNLG